MTFVLFTKILHCTTIGYFLMVFQTHLIFNKSIFSQQTDNFFYFNFFTLFFFYFTIFLFTWAYFPDLSHFTIKSKMSCFDDEQWSFISQRNFYFALSLFSSLAFCRYELTLIKLMILRFLQSMFRIKLLTFNDFLVSHNCTNWAFNDE